MDVCICVRMSEVISVVRPGYGHFNVPIIELILQINICLGYFINISQDYLDTVSKSCIKSAMSCARFSA